MNMFELTKTEAGTDFYIYIFCTFLFLHTTVLYQQLEALFKHLLEMVVFRGSSKGPRPPVIGLPLPPK